MVYGIGIDGLFKSRRGPKAELSNFLQLLKGQ